MKTKTILITGATSGIGLAAAKALSKQDFNLVFLARDAARASQTITLLKGLSNNEEIYSLPANLSSLKEVKAVAPNFMATFGSLDILINNAGVFHTSRQITTDGIEDTYAVNYFAPFLLTNSLLDLMNLSKDARVINVSSVLHTRPSHFSPEMLADTKSFSGLRNYGISKLALNLFSNELARKTVGSSVISNVLHPGGIATSITRDNFFINLMTKLVGASVEKGIVAIEYLATTQNQPRLTGKYLVNRDIKQPSGLSLNLDLASQLWKWTEDFIALKLA